MKKLKKLTEEERKADRRERAKNVTRLTLIISKGGKPREIAKLIAQDFFESRSHGAWEIFNAVGRYKDQRFLGKMLRALGEYIEKGQSRFDKVEWDISGMMLLPLDTPVYEIVSELKTLHPGFTFGALEKRYYRKRNVLLHQGIIKDP